MGNYLVLIRTEPAKVAGKGADRGDVISIRPEGARVTDTEKKRLLTLQVEMTEAEVAQLQEKIRPQTIYAPISPMPDPETSPDEALAWQLAFKEAINNLPAFGLRVDLQAAFTQQQVADIDNPEKKVEPITAGKTILEEVEKAKP